MSDPIYLLSTATHGGFTFIERTLKIPDECVAVASAAKVHARLSFRFLKATTTFQTYLRNVFAQVRVRFARPTLPAPQVIPRSKAAQRRARFHFQIDGHCCGRHPRRRIFTLPFRSDGITQIASFRTSTPSLPLSAPLRPPPHPPPSFCQRRFH